MSKLSTQGTKWLRYIGIGSVALFGALAAPTAIDQVQIAALPQHEKLKTNATDVLDAEERDGEVEYLYKAEELLPEQDELVERRTSTTRSYRRGNKIAVFFDATTPYHKDAEGRWWKTEKATTTKRAFDLQTKSIAHAQTFLTESPGIGNQTWNVPADWNSSNNSIECIGSGGRGADGNAGTASGAGGGGGTYAKITNLTLTPSGTATYAIGASATTTTETSVVGAARETYFNGSASTSASLWCGWGKMGNGATPGARGATSTSPGVTTFTGGTGGDGESGSTRGGAGGGGSGGPTGYGRPGGGVAISSTGGAGGGGSNGGSSTDGSAPTNNNGAVGGHGTDGTGRGTAGTGGSTCSNGGDGTSTKGAGAGGGGRDPDVGGTSCRGGAGSIDTAFDSTHGAGGGGGGGGGGGSSGAVGGNGGTGGTYGGGGGGGGSRGTIGGSAGTGSLGGQGIIVITYTPAAGAAASQDDTYFDIVD
jgi:hypothetical protein